MFLQVVLSQIIFICLTFMSLQVNNRTNMINGYRTGRDKVASADQDIQFYVLVKGKIFFLSKITSSEK